MMANVNACCTVTIADLPGRRKCHVPLQRLLNRTGLVDDT